MSFNKKITFGKNTMKYNTAAWDQAGDGYYPYCSWPEGMTKNKPQCVACDCHIDRLLKYDKRKGNPEEPLVLLKNFSSKAGERFCFGTVLLKASESENAILTLRTISKD